MYGVGRGRAIGHLLQGALPDPSWLPPVASLLSEDSGDGSDVGVAGAADPTDAWASEALDPGRSGVLEPPRPPARFQPGDRVSNNSGSRGGRIDAELPRWIPSVRLASGDLRPGHWSYAVAWDGQLGLTIRYAEDLLRPAGFGLSDGDLG